MVAEGFYVYALTVDGTIRYIGKGSGRRGKRHLDRARLIVRRRAAGEKVHASILHNRLAKAIRSGLSVRTEVLHSGLSEDEAFSIEERLIAEFLPQLWNLRSGGRTGTVIVPEFRAFMSRKVKLAMAKPEIKQRLSKAMREAHNTPEFRAWRSVNASERMNKPEKKAEMGERSRAMWLDPDHKERHRQALREAHQRPEVKAKRRAYYDSPEGRENLRRASLTRHAKKAAASFESA